jgi:hypothetical protein
MSNRRYEDNGRELAGRILALIPGHPEILSMDEPWGLFRLPGFRCDDLDPTLAMAGEALSIAKTKFHERETFAALDPRRPA